MRPTSWARRAIVHLSSTYFFANFTLAQAYGLSQEYCSAENTGDDTEAFYDQYQSNGSCYTHCEYEGYALAVVKGYYCWCSNYVPAEQVSVSRCNLPCWGFSSENCGSSGNLYGYIAVQNKPSGTVGAVNAKSTSKAASSVYHYSSSTKSFVSMKVSTELKTMQPNLVTIDHTVTMLQTSEKLLTSTPTNTPTDATPTPSNSIEKITVSGAVVTHTVTSVASAPPSNNLPVKTSKSSGLSGGAIAGIVIGVLVGVAALALIGFCLCWYQPRKREREESDVPSSNATPQRESSVLSRVGLVGAPKQPRPLQPLPKIRTSGFGGRSTDPNSQETISPMSQRRNSQPMFIDNRLNPNTLMAQSNTSKTSVSTLQDNQDYSRPVLSVRNPDVYEGT